jgi:hypothetical protein
MTRSDLQEVVLEALNFLGGQGTITQICKYIWDRYEKDLRASGDLFYHWQYDMRWAGQQLRNAGRLVESRKAPRGLWILRD